MARRVLSTIISCSDLDTAFLVSISQEGKVYLLGKAETALQAPKKRIRYSFTNSVYSIAGGAGHVICLDVNGSVYTIGSNEYGQLGIGKNQEELSITFKIQRVNLPPVKQVACGQHTSICVSEDGFVYSFGRNKFGQLGLGNLENYHSPQQIESLNNVDFLACGAFHVICKTLSNDIYCWGSNEYGQLGTEDLLDKITPFKCDSFSGIVDIKCGFVHTLILTSNQEVYSCGSNKSGQLGRNDGKYDIYCFLLFKIEDLANIIRIECGRCHSMCIDSNNDLYIFGGCYHGQLGLGGIEKVFKPKKHPLSNIIDVSSGGCTTFVKTSNNEIFAFGSNKNSYLGISKEELLLTPVQYFKGYENLWCSNISSSKCKSARNPSV